MSDIDVIRSFENYSVCSIGKFEELNKFEYKHPLLKDVMVGKVFVGEVLDTSSMEISFQVLPRGKEIPFNHKHKTHEEVYVVLKGRGCFYIDGEVTEVSEGSLIRIAPQANRRWYNPYEEELLVMVIQAVHNTLQNYTVFDGYVEPEADK